MNCLQEIFDKKHKADKILVREGAVSISDLSFPKHRKKGNLQVIMASHNQMEIERDE